MQVYSVVGSRHVPDHWNTMMTRMSIYFEDNGYILRTRGRDGFEKAAVDGIDLSHNKLIVPGNNWTVTPSKLCYEIAWDNSAKWLDLNEHEKTRRAYIVQVLLGHKLNSKSKFLITYTEDDYTSEEVAFAIRVARTFEIRTFDLAQYSFSKLWEEVQKL